MYSIIGKTRLTAGNVEQLLSVHLSESKRSSQVQFDLTETEWLGYYPGLIIFAWISHLVSLGVRVVVELPKTGDTSSVFRKHFIDSEVSSHLKGRGVEFSRIASPRSFPGVPVRILSKDKVSSIKKGDFFNLMQEVPIETLRLGTARDTLEVLLRELLENACIHGAGRRPYYGLTYSRSSGQISKQAKGMFHVPDSEQEYAEIVLGDLGPGITKNLQAHLPKAYKPRYPKHSGQYSKNEQVLSLAFEFSTTSDEASRVARLDRLIRFEEAGTEPGDIASGLFVVMEMVRSHGGQLIVRTPHAILSYDFFLTKDKPKVTGRRDLGPGRMANLPGTHYLIRIPISKYYDTAESSLPKGTVELPCKRISVIRAFPTEDLAETISIDWATRLHLAVGRVDSSLRNLRGTEGVTMILPTSFPMPSRVAALFLAAIQSMYHGKRSVIWLNYGSNLKTALVVRDSSSPKRGFDPSPCSIGDILANSFQSAFYTEREVDPEFSLDERTYGRLLQEYSEVLSNDLHRLLQNKEIRRTPGPFLIEGKYYTSVFYSIGEALESQAIAERLAEWCLLQLSPNIDVLIVSSEILAPLAAALNERLGQVGRPELEVVTFKREKGIPGNLVVGLPLFKKRCVVLTDVVCRGKVVNRILTSMGMMNIEGIVTVVDARPEMDLGKSLVVGSGTEARVVGLASLIAESIEPKHDEPRDVSVEWDENIRTEERVYVIDEKTNAPTLYTRQIPPALSIRDFLYGPEVEAGALIARHASYRGKHYTYFLDLPVLFRGMQAKLEHWVTDQVSFIERATKYRDEEWWSFVYNPDGALDWIIPFLRTMPQSMSVESIAWEAIDAPEPPSTSKRGGKCLLLIPAIESGEVTRRCLELVSRYMPHEVLVLCVLSRMDPYNLSFMSGISEYRGARIHVSFFMEFSISAYGLEAQFCPVCQHLNELSEVNNLAERETRNTVTEVLNGRIDSLQAVDVEFVDTQSIEDRTSQRDFDRALVRALYEAASVDVVARRELNQLLENSLPMCDRFLEALALERLNGIFQLEKLDKRLYKARSKIDSRVDFLLWKSSPPFPIGRFVGAFIHLAPYNFLDAAQDLVIRFIESFRDVAEIGLGLMLLGLEPISMAEVLSFIEEEVQADSTNRERVMHLRKTQGFLTEVASIISAQNEREKDATKRAINAIPVLWARISRSGRFTTGLDGLRGGEHNDDWSTREYLSLLVLSWKTELANMISEILHSPLGQYLSKRRPELGAGLINIQVSMGRLSVWNDMSRTSENEANGDRSENAAYHRQLFIAGSEELSEAVSIVREHLYNLFVQPSHSFVVSLGDELEARDGSRIVVHHKIDYTVPQILCDLEDLEFALAQVVDNWMKHKTAGAGGENAWIILSFDGSKVIFEFRDDIGGKFDLSSEGGVRQIQQFGKSYGVDIEFEQPETEFGEKAVRFKFWPIGQGSVKGGG